MGSPIKRTNFSVTIITNEELYTVGSQHAVITWVTPQQRADTSMHIGKAPKHLIKHTIALDTEFHYAEMYNLKPSTRYWYQVESNGVKGSLNSFTTLPQPKGKYLFSFAVMSDTHINYGEVSEDINEIYLGKLVAYANPLLIQCILDSKRRDIDLAVITGDLTDTASSLQYSGLRNQLLPYFGDTPYLLCTGNHDKYTKNSGLGEQGFLDNLTGREKTYTSIIFKDYLFLLIDSCKQNDNWGYIDPVQMQWLESMLTTNRGLPAFLFLHHPCNGPDLWFGIKNHREFLKLTRPFPNIQGVFCGHVHRNHVTTNRFTTGSRAYVEVPATVQFPCAYAIVRVYEDGFEYNSYKVSRLDLSEMSRERFILKNGGKAILTRYCLGRIGDRSFSYFDNQLFRPKQYEVSVTLEKSKANELYENALSIDGASLVPAYDTQKSKVILGRYDCLPLTMQALRQKYSRYGMHARVIEDGFY
ncbi:MAG: metallophosphoesterase family protein [Desulfotomaculaceae bacterium]|nr:metallophosphoesterase family protein [Desulfotomaculaceae bacterium]